MSDGTSWQSRITENAQRYQDLDQRLSRLSITEVSRDGAVRVTVSPRGLMTNLVLTGQTPQAQLAAQIMDCVRRAQARIPDLLRQEMTASVGTADPNVHLLVADARQRFPEPPPPGGPTAPPPRRATPEQWDEERPSVWDD